MIRVLALAALLTACGFSEERRYSCQLLVDDDVSYVYWTGTPDDVQQTAEEWADACSALESFCMAVCVRPWRPPEEQVDLILVTKERP